MKYLIIKILMALFFAFVGTFGIYNQKAKILHETKQTYFVSTQLQLIINHINKLQNDIFRDKFYLYFDNDIINNEINKVDGLLDNIIKNNDFKKNQHQDVLLALQKEEKSFEKLKGNIYKFLKYNAPIKNSSMYLSKILEDAFRTFNINNKKDRAVLLIFSKAENTIFVHINSFDNQSKDDLIRYQKEIDNLSKSIKNEKEKRLAEIFSLHMSIFINNFSILQKSLDSITSSNIDDNIRVILKKYIKESTIEQKEIGKFSNLLLILYLFSIAIILFFIFYSEKENIKLKKLSQKLYISTITDKLTGLGNRVCLKEDKKSFKNPALILINIDCFKDINSLYGVDFGDKVLKLMAQKIKYLSKNIKNAKTYRLGGDDFAILYKFQNLDNLQKNIKNILNHINDNNFVIDKYSVSVSISIGASHNQYEAIKCSTIALKKIKSSNTTSYQIYEDNFDTAKEIEKNMEILSLFKKALLEDRVVPYFQPIVDLKSEKIIKYEALVRLITPNGEVLPPFMFLNIAKKAKLIGEITKTVLYLSLKKIREKNIYVSVNIPYSNIIDLKIKKQIIQILEENRDIADHLTFELLEDEQMHSYEHIANFISSVKEYNCKISVDDFGTGYSNFEELLRLDIDTLKIDGSLIKNINKDNVSKIIAKTILEFSKKTNLEVIAEFVHSKEVSDELKKIGIKLAQGYYFGKPSPNI